MLPSSPPWVTFGTHRLAVGRRFISVAVLFPWAEVDWSSRPIWPRNFFVLSYDDMVQHGVGFRTLYRSIQEIRLPFPGESPIQLWPARQQMEELEHIINRFGGHENLAVIASALLDGPVAVAPEVNRIELDREARLDLLDAIAALLPRGFRADLSASTAVSGLNVPEMRLILTGDEDGEHQQLRLDGDGRPVWSEGAREYYELLLRKVETRGLPEVLRYLWRYQEPFSFTPREAAIEIALRILGDLDRAAELARKASDPSLIDARFTFAYFAESRDYLGRNWKSLPLASRTKFLLILLNSDQQQAIEALVRTWDVVVRDLITVVIGDLDRGSTELARSGLRAAAAAGQPKSIDQYLEYILVSWLKMDISDTREEFWPERIRARVELLLSVDVPRQGEYVETRIRLRFGTQDGWQARLVRKLLATEFAADPTRTRARAWALWLCGSVGRLEKEPQDWLAALDFTVGKHSGLSPAGSAAIDRLTSADPSWVMLLTSTAEAFGRLPDTLEPLGRGLIRYVRDGRGRDDGALASMLGTQFRQPGVAAADLAWVDGARVLAGLAPGYMPDTGHVDLFEQYINGLDSVFAFLGNAPEHQHLIQDAFQAHALPAGQHADKRLPPGAVHLIQRWARSPDLAPRLAWYIRNSGTDSVLLRYNQLAPDDWGLLARHVPEFKPLQHMGLLVNAIVQAIQNKEAALARETSEVITSQGIRRVSVNSSALAVALYDASVNGMSPEQILNIIKSSVFSRTEYSRRQTFIDTVNNGEFWNVLLEFESLLSNRPLDRENSTPEHRMRQAKHAQDTWIQFLDLIIEGRIFGGEYASRFRDMVNDRTKQGEHRYKLLRRRYRPGMRRRRRADQGKGKRPGRERRSEGLASSPGQSQPTRGEFAQSRGGSQPNGYGHVPVNPHQGPPGAMNSVVGGPASAPSVGQSPLNVTSLDAAGVPSDTAPSVPAPGAPGAQPGNAQYFKPSLIPRLWRQRGKSRPRDKG